MVSSCFRVRFYPVSLREAGVITGESFCSEKQKKRRRKAPFEFPALARKGGNLKHPAEPYVESVLRVVSAIVLYVELEHDLRMNVETQTGCDNVFIVDRINSKASRDALLSVVILIANEGHDIDIATAIDMISGLDEPA